jgi:hypothetical protein
MHQTPRMQPAPLRQPRAVDRDPTMDNHTKRMISRNALKQTKHVQEVKKGIYDLMRSYTHRNPNY